MVEQKVAVVGLGYVGLPLALAFGRVMPTIGFDVSVEKIDAYRQGFDPTGEMDADAFKQAQYLECSSDAARLAEADMVVVAVPTPIDSAQRPNLSPLKRAAETVAAHLSKGTTVVFESTVYPGVTEDICVGVLERGSGLRCGQDFFVGYSPERINPGDHEHRLTTITKVVSGQDAATLERVALLYERIITAGVHRAPSIKVAEAAKVIENTQRDLNIALMNELALMFDKMGIDTMDVLEAAGTKWNFLPFRPGLVGGHCIGVDPYYLVDKAESLGYHPDVIISGRRINDSMGKYVAEQTVKRMLMSGQTLVDCKVLVMGLTFKEECRDLRNTRVVDIIRELESYGIQVLVHDPIADKEEASRHYGISLLPMESVGPVNAVVVAVAHQAIRAIAVTELAALTGKGIPLMDVKSIYDRDALAQAGFVPWRL